MFKNLQSCKLHVRMLHEYIFYLTDCTFYIVTKKIPYYILLLILIYYIYFSSFLSKPKNRQQIFVYKFALNSLIGPNENVYIRTDGQTVGKHCPGNITSFKI